MEVRGHLWGLGRVLVKTAGGVPQPQSKSDSIFLYPCMSGYLIPWDPGLPDLFLSCVLESLHGDEASHAMCHYVRVCVRACRVSFEKNVLGGGHSYAFNFITPCAHAQQGIKLSVLSVVGTKIVRSGDLGIWATPKHNRSVKIIDKLALLCFKPFGNAYKHCKCCVFWPHLSTAPTAGHLLMHII